MRDRNEYAMKTATIEKEYVRADDLIRDAFRLARAILDSGFRPDALLALWRGGTPVGIVIHEFLEFMGVPTLHQALKAASYTGIGERGEPRIDNIEVFMAALRPESRVLVVDDIFDSGRTLQKVQELLFPVVREVRLAALYYKPAAARVPLKPDYFLRTTDRWVVFPHELIGLTDEEIRRKDEAIYRCIRP